MLEDAEVIVISYFQRLKGAMGLLEDSAVLEFITRSKEIKTQQLSKCIVREVE